MKIWKCIVLGIISIPVAIIILLASVYVYMDLIKVEVKEGYNNKIETGGSLESKYLLGGGLNVKKFTFKEDKPIRKVSVFYPEELETCDKKYPMILILNGTGGKTTKYEPVFRMYASWGFIVVGTQDKGTGTGMTTVKVLNDMLALNNDSGSILYDRIDTENIGVTGFSQGGAGVFNVLTKYDEGRLIKAAAPLSPVSERMTALTTDYTYDSSLIECPIMILCGTEGEFETEIVIPLEELTKQYDKITSSKVMARRTGMDHDKMMSHAGGYVIAWFRWLLLGDDNAAKVFTGEAPELFLNPLYQDQKSSF